MSRAARLPAAVVVLAGVGSALAATAGHQRDGTSQMSGFDATFKVDIEHQAKDYTVQQIGSSSAANVFWPGEKPSIILQFSNKTGAKIDCLATIEVVNYATRTDLADVFKLQMMRVGEVSSVPVKVEIPAKGFVNVTVSPPIPEAFGGYGLVADLGPLGRDFVAGCVRALPGKAGRVQFPTFALDVERASPEVMGTFARLGVKGARLELGYVPTTAADFPARMLALGQMMEAVKNSDVTVMLTLGGGGPQPLGRARPFLDEKNTFLPTKADIAWLPAADEDFQKSCKLIAATHGWPKGPLNAMELWNEPWEGISISGWGADQPRYREIYTHMAKGIEEARAESGVQVLIGGTCSSMNTLDKLFPDGKNDFLKWLDFTSLHYQSLGSIPVLIPEWMNRKSPNGPVKVWDTESWIANSEDRVAPVLAGLRATGLSRTAGVFHTSVYHTVNFDERLDGGAKKRASIVETWTPAAAVAAFENLVGERPFREILFKQGLPWVMLFDGQEAPASEGEGAFADDAMMVVVGDLSMAFPRDQLLFRTVYGLNESGAETIAKFAAIKKQLAELPADAKPKVRADLEKLLKYGHVLEGGSLTIADEGGIYRLYDSLGNRVAAKDGKLTVPLNTMGYFLGTDGSKGSMAKLVGAVQSADIRGIEPVEIVMRDMTARIENKPAMRVRLSNVLNRPIRGKFEATSPGLTLKDAAQEITLALYEVREIELRVEAGKAVAANTYPLSVRFDGGADGLVVRNENLHVNVIEKRTVTVDGDLRDWENALPQPAHAPAVSMPNVTEQAWYPFSPMESKTGGGFATAYLAYDEQYFYFAAKIADNTPDEGTLRFETRNDDEFFYPEKSIGVTRDPKTKAIVKTEELTWPEGVRRYTYRMRPPLPSGNATDNVQIAFNVLPLGENGWLSHPKGTMPRFMMYRDTNYEYALNQVAAKYGGGTEIWRLFAPGMQRKHFYPRQLKGPNEGPVKEGKLVMVRKDDMRIVEAAIPWGELPEVRKCLDAGKTVKFSYRVNDNNPRSGSYELAQERSISKENNYAFHDDWMTSWANEVEFAFERPAGK